MSAPQSCHPRQLYHERSPLNRDLRTVLVQMDHAQTLQGNKYTNASLIFLFVGMYVKKLRYVRGGVYD